MARKLSITAAEILRLVSTRQDVNHTRKNMADLFGKPAYSALACLKRKKLVRVTKDGTITALNMSARAERPVQGTPLDINSPETAKRLSASLLEIAKKEGWEMDQMAVGSVASNAMAALADLVAENHRLNQVINQLRGIVNNEQ